MPMLRVLCGIPEICAARSGRVHLHAITIQFWSSHVLPTSFSLMSAASQTCLSRSHYLSDSLIPERLHLPGQCHFNPRLRAI